MKILQNTLIAIALIMGACESNSLDYSADMSSESGTGGSLARFTISGNYLYTVDASTLKTFDITNESKPQLIGEQELNWGVETIFALDNMLFLGTRTGIYIYDISSPSTPEYVSLYSHVQSCDPVVVKGNYAYSTLNSSGPCSQGVDQLDIIDISHPSDPQWVNTISMNSPKGLGISGSLLFVCDGGLKVYDLSNPINPSFIHRIDIDATDVIPIDTLLLVATNQGLSEYSIDDENQIHFVSTLYTSK
jgi:hypothetical protein